MLLKLENIRKEYVVENKVKFDALKGVTLGFDKGEFISILGPSGCGKSTLLNIIAGLDKPTEGNLIVEGKSTGKYKSKDWDLYRKNNIGFVFQSFNLIEHLTALENIEMVMNLIGLSKKERIERAKMLLEKVGLSKHMNHKPGELSGGQKQRVAIARALANDPDIILADEPTGALDKKTGIQIMNLLKEIAKDKLILMVTHNGPLAYEYSSRVISILDGEIMKDEILIEADKNQLKSELKKKNGSMSLKDSLKLSLRNIKQKIGRIAITTIAGSIGIGGILLVVGLGNGANDYIDRQTNSFVSANVIQVGMSFRDQEVQAKEYPKTIEAFDKINENNNVVDIREALDITSNTIYEVNGEKIEKITFNSLAGENYLANIEHAIEGRLPKDDSFELLVNKDMAKQIVKKLGMDAEADYKSAIDKPIKVSVEEKAVNPLTGDETVVRTYTKEFTIVGIANEIALNSGAVYYSYEPVYNWLRDEGYFIGKENRVINAEVVVDEVKHNETVLDWINAKENGGIGERRDPAEKGFKASSQVVMVKEALKMLINLAQAVMIVFVSVALVVSSILIGIVVFSSVLERKKEIGILKAVGARNKDVSRVFKAESALIGFFAGVTGIVVAFLIQPLANKFIEDVLKVDAEKLINIPLSGIPFTNVKFPFATIIGLIVISVLVAIMAGYVPSKRATKIQVVDALRDE
ncbi:MAG: ATP-binding cassette domain-containing protein [Clostridium sp.]|uniref:ABC transporter ATP-binding protein/permease n=1 Tax=Clostridium sp. TaxID=1506 RepID=UPI00304E1757